MSKSAKSMFVFGIYLIVIGLGFLVIPNVLLPLFGFPKTNEVWVRVVGMLLLFLAFFCIQTARKELTDFFQLTVYTRASVIIFLIIFVALGFAKPMLILFGVIDLLAAIWTWLALRSSKAE